LSTLLAFTNANEHEMAKAWPDLRPQSKLALYSAHDTSLMALLSSLGPLVWDGTEHPPYASMIVIELYEITAQDDGGDVGINTALTGNLEVLFPTGIAFRLIYNGVSITHKLSGCPPLEEVCDIDLLVMHVFEFSNVTEWEEMCEVVKEPEVDVEPKKVGPSTALKAFQYTMLVMFCTGMGAFAMHAYMSRKLHASVTEKNSLDLGLEVQSSPSAEEYADQNSLYGHARRSSTAAII